MSGSGTTPAFRPRFTLGIAWFFAFLLLYLFLMALPALMAGARELPPGETLTEEQREEAGERTREALRGRVPYAVLASLVTVGLGAWTGRLPGYGDRGRR